MNPIWYGRIQNICIVIAIAAALLSDRVSGVFQTLIGIVAILVTIVSVITYFCGRSFLRRQRKTETIEGLEKLLDNIGKEIIDKINKREVIKLIKPEWREEFMECVKTGKASQELLEYLDTDVQGQEAVKIVLGIMGEKHEKLDKDLKGLLSRK